MSGGIEEQERIGQRVRRQRLSVEMTQADLAAAVGRTQGWVSKLEKGRIELDRAGLINAVAAALHCHPNTLIERPYSGGGAETKWQVSAASIIRELRRYDLAPVFDGTPRLSEVLWHDMKRLLRLRDAAANAAVLKELPDMLREARALAEASTGHEREEAFAIYAVACKFAHTAAHALGHPELVAMACARTTWSAQLSGDPVMPAMALWMRMWDTWASADWDDALALGDKALAGIEAEYEAGDPLALRMWGALHLRAAISSARGGNAAGSDERLALARTAGERVNSYVGPEIHDRHSVTFSLGNVVIHGVSAALEMSDQTKALRLNREADPAHIAVLPNSRLGHHHMDLARAWLWDGNRDQALTELETAERIAPQLVRNHPVARATLRKITYAERAATSSPKPSSCAPRAAASNGSSPTTRAPARHGTDDALCLWQPYDPEEQRWTSSNRSTRPPRPTAASGTASPPTTATSHSRPASAKPSSGTPTNTARSTATSSATPWTPPSRTSPTTSERATARTANLHSS